MHSFYALFFAFFLCAFFLCALRTPSFYALLYALFLCSVFIRSFYVLFLCPLLLCSLYLLFICALFICSLYSLFSCAILMCSFHKCLAILRIHKKYYYTKNNIADNKTDDVLKKLGPSDHRARFVEEKISTDIVCYSSI